MRRSLVMPYLFCLCCTVFWGCGKESNEAAAAMQTFAAKGVVKELDPDGKTVVISHEAISNYMPAMTMPFEAADTNALRGLSAGDTITFHLVVTPTHGWIEDIAKVASSPTKPAAPQAAANHLSFTRALAPLDEGDTLPDYQFTNELGAPARLSQFRGSVLAFTFFFTSCPFPDFCPRMTRNFEEAEIKLSRMTNAPARWQLLSISFDPTNDTPKRLKTYAEAAHYDPGHWSFLTGDEGQIGGLADQLGENFWREGASVGHNLRTVVVDPKGRICKIMPGNKWTVDELVEQMVKAGE
jgi:protein SCO1/2